MSEIVWFVFFILFCIGISIAVLMNDKYWRNKKIEDTYLCHNIYLEKEKINFLKKEQSNAHLHGKSFNEILYKDKQDYNK